MANLLAIPGTRVSVQQPEVRAAPPQPGQQVQPDPALAAQMGRLMTGMDPQVQAWKVAQGHAPPESMRTFGNAAAEALGLPPWAGPEQIAARLAQNDPTAARLGHASPEKQAAVIGSNFPHLTGAELTQAVTGQLPGQGQSGVPQPGINEAPPRSVPDESPIMPNRAMGTGGGSGGDWQNFELGWLDQMLKQRTPQKPMNSIVDWMLT